MLILVKVELLVYVDVKNAVVAACRFPEVLRLLQHERDRFSRNSCTSGEGSVLRNENVRNGRTKAAGIKFTFLTAFRFQFR